MTTRKGRPISWKTLRAAKLRQMGVDYDAIAERLGLTVYQARHVAQNAKKLKYDAIGQIRHRGQHNA